MTGGSTTDDHNLLNGETKTISFFGPRIHNNQVGWISALKEAGFKVNYLVFGHTRNATIADLDVHVVPESWASRAHRLFFQSGEFEEYEDRLRATYIPSFFWLLLFFFNNKPTVFISRDKTRASIVAQLAARAAGVSTRFFYVQEPIGAGPVEAEAEVNEQGVLKRLFLRMSGVADLGSLTPLISAELLPVIADRQSWRDSEQRHFLPFVVNIRKPNLDDSVETPGRILVLAKYRNYKNLFALPKALHQVRRQIRKNLSLVVAGEALTSSENDLCEKLGAALNEVPELSFTMKQNLSHRDAMLLMGSCDVLILPSYFDLAPIAPLEAMAAGVVPIVSSKAGTSCFISQAKSGFLFDPDNHLELARILSTIFSPGFNINRIKRAAFESASSIHSPENFLAAFRHATSLHPGREIQ